MSLSYHQAIDKDKIETKLLAIFNAEIKQLQGAGFTELYFVREVGFALSALFLPLMFLNLLRSRDVWKIGGFFQLTFFNPLLYNYHYGSYGHIMDSGVTLVTRFIDGTALISCNYEAGRLHLPAHNIHCYKYPGASIEDAWQQHKEQIHELEEIGYETDADLTLEKYTQIIQISDKLSLLHIRSERKTDKSKLSGGEDQ